MDEGRWASAAQDRALLSEWNRRVAAGEVLPLAEAWEHAAITEQVLGGDAALPMYQLLVVRAPDDAAPLIAAGRILLEIGDPDGVTLLERAMTLDHESTVGACQLLFHYYRRHGDEDATQEARTRMLNYQAQADAAARERAGWAPGDALIAHRLPEATLAKVRAQLRQYPRITRAYLACKAVRHFPERPLYVFGFALPWWAYSTHGHRALLDKLAAELTFPGETLVVPVSGHRIAPWKNLAKRLRTTPETLFYRRES